MGLKNFLEISVEMIGFPAKCLGFPGNELPLESQLSLIKPKPTLEISVKKLGDFETKNTSRLLGCFDLYQGYVTNINMCAILI